MNRVFWIPVGGSPIQHPKAENCQNCWGETVGGIYNCKYTCKTYKYTATPFLNDHLFGQQVGGYTYPQEKKGEFDPSASSRDDLEGITKCTLHYLP